MAKAKLTARKTPQSAPKQGKRPAVGKAKQAAKQGGDLRALISAKPNGSAASNAPKNDLRALITASDLRSTLPAKAITTEELRKGTSAGQAGKAHAKGGLAGVAAAGKNAAASAPNSKSGDLRSLIGGAPKKDNKIPPTAAGAAALRKAAQSQRESGSAPAGRPRRGSEEGEVRVAPRFRAHNARRSPSPAASQHHFAAVPPMPQYAAQQHYFVPPPAAAHQHYPQGHYAPAMHMPAFQPSITVMTGPAAASPAAPVTTIPPVAAAPVAAPPVAAPAGVATGPLHAFTIRLSNLAPATTEHDLYAVLARLGPVADVYLRRDERSGRSTGVALITFSDEQGAREAIAKYNDTLVDGLMLKCDMVQTPPHLVDMIQQRLGRRVITQSRPGRFVGAAAQHY